MPLTARAKKRLIYTARRIIEGDKTSIIAEVLDVNIKRVSYNFNHFLRELDKHGIDRRKYEGTRGYKPYRNDKEYWLAIIDLLETQFNNSPDADDKSATKKEEKGKKPKTDKQSLLQYARDNGKTPAEFMIDIMHGKSFKDGTGQLFTPSAQDMIAMAKEVGPYCHPKLRAQEIKGEMIPATLNIVGA